MGMGCFWSRSRVVLLLTVTLLLAPIGFAQQTGAIQGKVTAADGTALPGVTVEATSNVLPQARVITTSVNGEYKFPALPPGKYALTFSLAGMQTQTRNTQVFLDQETFVNVQMGIEQVAETITVVAETPFIDRTSTAIKSALGNDAIQQLPVEQEYKDLEKLIPGVQYSEDEVRGPSAGGSGQDNVYEFDGVNVTLPLFGVLSAEPSTHDIEQIAITKGGAKALDFNRAGGFHIDSVSKSGTGDFAGRLSYQIQTDSMTSDRDTVSDARFDEDRDWATIGIGGPIARDLAYFYASYYRPTRERENRSNLYGDVPNFDSVRDEFFGKLTFTPTSSILLHASYRDSETDQEGSGVSGSATAGTASIGNDSTLGITIVEGSWLITDNSYATFKYSDFENETSSRPDNLLDFQIARDGSVGLDVNNLDRQGLFLVPQPIDGATEYNQFIAPIIDQYGFQENGMRNGGGVVGVGSTINDQDFFREGIQLAYDISLGSEITHDIHIGYQWHEDIEDLSRTSNGWGVIEVIGGRDEFEGEPIFYQARFEQQSLNEPGTPPTIVSEFEAQNIELNDTIRWNDWTFNVGVLLSQDTLYGQGLRENPSNVSGFELAPGNKYEMYEIPFEDQIQPRLGVTWAYDGLNTVYTSYAEYNPAASSLPRAASWGRNLRRSIRAFFDADGNFIGSDPVGSSSGKFFQPNLDPRQIDEWMIGTSRRVTDRLVARAYARYRYGHNFWEDTNNNARLVYEPPAGVPRELYIPNLDAFRDEVGGSSYVIAELDGAFTKYYEVSIESEWTNDKVFLRGTYTWSHYYGNFDQDNTTTSNDQAIFIGSSFLADGAGRQVWDNRYGNLKGDRRHILKVYGFYDLPWSATAGMFGVYQSGQPWEAWDREVYADLAPAWDTSDTSRFAEPAGSRTTSSHYQLDLNYTHNFNFWDPYSFQLAVDVFNVTDNQTGYNIQNKVNEANFGEPRSFYDPRRWQVALRFLF